MKNLKLKTRKEVINMNNAKNYFKGCICGYWNCDYAD